mmetsp:Transcript_7404/g.20770  ORF Transcript_7404/g.20770 Transcript_7404/m.20770 type:complete len:289 (+) Transcript_7404:65-931(+)
MARMAFLRASRQQLAQKSSQADGTVCLVSQARAGDLRPGVQAQLLGADFAHVDLAYLAGHRLRELVLEEDVLRHLEVCHPLLDVLTDVALCLLSRRRARWRSALPDNPGTDLLTQPRVRHADDGGVADAGVRDEGLLDLLGEDVLPTAEDHVLDPADDPAEAVVRDGRKVACAHPPLAVSEDDGGARGLGVLPVARHHAVACGPELSGRVAGQHLPGLGVHHHALRVGMDLANGRAREVEGGADARLKGHGRGLGHPIRDGHLPRAHLADDPLHGVLRAEGTSHDARA